MTPLLEFLDENHISWREGGTHSHVRHGWIGLQCPWCKSSSWHLGIRLTDGYTSCWKCGAHRLGDVLKELSDEPWSAIKPVVSALHRHSGKHQKPRAEQVEIPKGVGPLLPAHRQYLKSRGFNPSELSRIWGVQGIGLAGHLSWRIFIPIKVQGQTVSWTTRAIGNQGQRYVSASPNQETISHKKILYGADLVPGHTVIICEGPADVWAIGPGAVATFGIVPSNEQIEELYSYPVRVVCYDSEPDAQRRANKLCERLGSEVGGQTFKIIMETGKDPGEASHDEITSLRTRFGLK
jgi:hypothetical protein